MFEYIKNGWPAFRHNVPKILHRYFQKRFQLTIHLNCILNCLQVAIPTKLRDTVMTELHETCAGIPYGAFFQGLHLSRISRIFCFTRKLFHRNITYMQELIIIIKVVVRAEMLILKNNFHDKVLLPFSQNL